MRAKVTIQFECEMRDVRDLEDNIRKNIKPMLDFYNTAGRVTVEPIPAAFIVEGLWNG